MFEHVDFFAGDPILSLVEVFKQDQRSEKVNLSIGVYYDENGKLPLLNSVKQAEEHLVSQHIPSAYLPMEGLLEFRKAAQILLFGEDNPLLKENKIQTVQTLGGSGALRVGAEFLHKYFSDSTVYVSDPTWGNHIAIFEAVGFNVEKYPYYDPETGGIKFEALVEFLKKISEKSIVLLHPCCHNPTGVDLTREEWDTILPIIKERNLIAFMDIAYQGLGDGLEEDAYAIRRAAYLGLSFFVSNSYSKNLSLYGERVGALSVVANTEEEAKLVFSQFQFAIRRLYSSPPFHAGHITSIVMNTPQLYEEWTSEVEGMKLRIREMRQKLYDTLSQNIPNKDFSYFTKQRGMFSFTGLTKEQVLRLRDEFAVYLVENGRMCISALNHHNIDYVANAFSKVLE
ncbi:aminotransferase class I/II-fold pyridoxal phosphate-dependent enzyme [Neisseriaceae bacterium PsAf]|nr:aminotransferase class I/II-fold pyridoxal phosphate-dependent enzyme [Neisseriaceae bacterium PsAf]